jgi:hypothetical protein
VFGGWSLYRYFGLSDELSGTTAVSTLVERIIAVESDGDPNAKNSRSSAMGLGQFLDETWLDLVRAYRPDLARGRSARETLDLRRGRIVYSLLSLRLHGIRRRFRLVVKRSEQREEGSSREAPMRSQDTLTRSDLTVPWRGSAVGKEREARWTARNASRVSDSRHKSR